MKINFDNKLQVILLLASFVVLLGGWTFQKQSGLSPVKMERYGQTQVLTEGAELKKYDTLFVGKETKVLLTEGSSKIWVGENTVLRVDQLKTADHADAIKIESGKVRVQIKSAEASHWKFETRSAVSGVRGTEFFIASTEATESVCVLEGVVESELSTGAGQKFVVPAGKGVQVREGEPAVMIDNSSFLVNQWVAETSIDEETGYIPSSYQNSSRVHKISDTVAANFDAVFFYCDLFNADFDKSASDSNRNCWRGHLYPSLLIKTAAPIRLTPRLSFVSSNQDTTFDAIPLTTSRQKTAVAVSEAYVNPSWSNTEIRLGFQKLNVADGVLLSEAKFTNEPLTHVGVRATTKLDGHDATTFISQGLEGQNAIDGYSPHSLVFFNSKVFESRGELYLLRADSLDPKDRIRPEIHQTNLGFLFRDRDLNFDFGFSGIYQNGSYKSSPTLAAVAVSESFVDVQLGYYLNSKARIFSRILDAGANYSSIAPAAYTLGLYPGFYQIGNITQARVGIDYRLTEGKNFTFEYIASWDHDRGGIVKWRSASANSSFIAEEVNFVFKHKWDDYLSYQAGGFVLFPRSFSSASDPAYGVQSWLVLSL